MVRKTGLTMPLAYPLGAALFCAHAARAQPDTEDRTLQRAGRIASQPVRDLGLAKDKVPAVLQAALEAPYASPGRCRDLAAQLAELNAALGPDFDSPPARGDDKATQIAEAGGAVLVNTLIPFRGLVREVTGAAAAERRKLAAINAGIARRGYLRGLARERGCRLPAARVSRQQKAEGRKDKAVR